MSYNNRATERVGQDQLLQNTTYLTMRKPVEFCMFVAWTTTTTNRTRQPAAAAEAAAARMRYTQQYSEWQREKIDLK